MDPRLQQALARLSPEQIEALSADVANAADEHGLTLTPELVEHAALTALSGGVHPSLSLMPQPAWSPRQTTEAEPDVEVEDYEPEPELDDYEHEDHEMPEPQDGPPDWSSMDDVDQARAMRDRLLASRPQEEMEIPVEYSGTGAATPDWSEMTDDEADRYLAARVNGYSLDDAA